MVGLRDSRNVEHIRKDSTASDTTGYNKGFLIDSNSLKSYISYDGFKFDWIMGKWEKLG